MSNAWTGKFAPRGALASNALGWGLKRRAQGPAATEVLTLAPGKLPDLRNWANPEVGWGLVLPENLDLSECERATAVDAPPAIQRLVAARAGAPVPRYRGEALDGYLRRYNPDGSAADLALAGTQFGNAPDCIPAYLLIFARPQIVPWRFQYTANMSRFVGRLALNGDSLEHYVTALLNDWAGSLCDARAPITWSVNSGDGDITWLSSPLATA